jgi:hypothetical protein
MPSIALHLVGALCLLAATGVALADVSEVVLAIHASSGRAAGVLVITADQGRWADDNFFWSTDEVLPIMSGSEVLGTFGPGRLEIDADPAIAMAFSAQAGESDTVFTLDSALLSFPALPGPRARVHGAFTLTDGPGTGAGLTGLLPGGYAFTSRLEDGLQFFSAIQEMTTAPLPAVSANFEHPEGGSYAPVPPTGGMAIEMQFALTPAALASGSVLFEVIPEPTSVALLVGSLALLRRR